MQFTNDAIKLLDKSGVKRAARIAGEAFAAYPVHAIFADDSEGRRVEIATAVFQMEIGYHCRRKGAYTLGGDFKEVAIFQDARRDPPKIALLPHLSFPILRTLRLVTKEERKAIARFGKEIKAAKKELYLPEGCVELVLLAVEPDHQGKGRAGRILRAALQELKAKGRACMLLTNTLKNTAIYGNYGFRVIKELQHDFEGLYSYFMLVQPEQMKG